MPYIWIDTPKNRTKAISEVLLSDGKTLHKNQGIATLTKEKLTEELNKFGIDHQKFLLMINPIFYSRIYPIESLVCQTILTMADGSEIYQHKTKIRNSYPNSYYFQSSMYKGSKVYQYGQVFTFDSIKKLDQVKKINIRWFIKDEISIVAETEIYPEFEYPELMANKDERGHWKCSPISENQPRWYYIKNIDSYKGDKINPLIGGNYFPKYEKMESKSHTLSEKGEIKFKQTLYPQLLPDNSFYNY